MAANHIFKIMFVNQGKVYEIYARKVSHGSLFGFVEVEELVFGERSTVLLDPAEERIKAEFNGVKRSYLPLQSWCASTKCASRASARSWLSKVRTWRNSPFPFTWRPGRRLQYAPK